MIEADFAKTIERIQQTLGEPQHAHAECLQILAAHLQAFVRDHLATFDFEGFPLPDDTQGVLCAYTLFQADGSGLSLRVNAIRGGVNSAVHNHGTWAVIVGIRGTEINRIYSLRADSPSSTNTGRRSSPTAAIVHSSITDRSTSTASAYSKILGFDREASVGPGQSLVLPATVFHSIHTPSDQPTLQLHLYGSDPDTSPGRAAVNVATGEWAILSNDADSH